MKTDLTRRQALLLLAQAAGSSAVAFQAARAFGFAADPGEAQPVQLRPLGERKRSVIILGAGISGLVSAYELQRAGYDVTLFEASGRLGGRNLTVRHGDVIDEAGNRQTCRFDDQPHLYFNAGPARIPAVHTGIMHYCRALGVEMELFSNHNKNCFTQDDDAFGGKPMRIREVEADARGFMAELLAKTLPGAGLDQPFDAQDLERLRAFLKSYGDLDHNYRYRGSARAGYAAGGALEPGVIRDPLAFRELLRTTFTTGPLNWRDMPWPDHGAMNFAEGEDQAPAMLTPRGGMDQIVQGFARALHCDIRLGAHVQRVTLGEDGVDIDYRQDGELRSARGDYCLNCIPTHLMTGIANNFPVDYNWALGTAQPGKMFKIGLQASERFWEAEGIYAGISWTRQDITQIWYPQQGIFARKGIVLGAYAWDPAIIDRFAPLDHTQRLAKALAEGERVHPHGYTRYMENGVSICWHRMNHMMGCNSHWSAEGLERGYPILSQPAGRHYMMGDQLSLLSGWQEGAVRSAWRALEDIERREHAAAV
ncbi:flavin monoamine oxidase family protein [Mangrovimicrobium sediminis]|nr:FAD-dependent oxidoreductase [Haliea sp. SAOS-164]